MSDVSNDFNAIAATEALPALGLLLLVAALASWFIAHRGESNHGWLEWFVALASLAAIVAVTTLRGELRLGFAPSNLLDWVADFERLSRDPLGSSQFTLNVALFVPAGALWSWLTRCPLKTFGAMASFSFVIECIQGVSGAGANDIVDLIANIIGAALGTGIAAVALQLLSRRASAPMSKRARSITLVAAAVVLLLLSVGWFFGAAARQQSVEASLRREFAGTNLQEIEQRLDQDPMAVLRIDGTLSDGAIFLDDSITYRYPATFFSLHRCVYVSWTANDVQFRKAYGSECSDFIDRG